MGTTTRRRRAKGKGAGTRKSKYTDEQIAAFRAQDAELVEQAQDALADPAFGAKVIAATGGGALSIARYSLTNQALLIRQAEDRGLDLRGGVGTYRQWKEAGRAVKADQFGQALFITRPVGRQDTDADEPTDGEQEGAPVRFRAKKVYARAQTTGIEDDADGQEPQADEDTDLEAAVYESLRKEAERAGYTLTLWEAHEHYGRAVEVDHDTRTIHVHDDAPGGLEQLAGILGEILTEQTRARREKRQATEPTAPAETVEEITVL
ncbi:ArdC-like ssDNA-binding domain-containing protein [Actinomadura opuntiae]|uniref:ArdC-like ssDNA-binding domain-containing protein n=1 Tax=Actinomadura sp. OS1-43 TaxID=604315 RepID=UPI00255AFFE0|nr:ArdC-like ssDNA-binding domain-containing protein [Actinomadura sp. OS1-43]MDL4812787.1 ArdC-like ssDNA-binding domain-containing protein [Actinomadura sp. OS1-43]